MSILKYDEAYEEVKLMKGEKEYCINVSQYTSEVLPTNINMLLVNYFYKNNNEDNKMKDLFNTAMNVLLDKAAVEAYIAVLYFDACLYYEEKKKATFVIERLSLASKNLSSQAKNDVK